MFCQEREALNLKGVPWCYTKKQILFSPFPHLLSVLASAKEAGYSLYLQEDPYLSSSLGAGKSSLWRQETRAASSMLQVAPPWQLEAF